MRKLLALIAGAAVLLALPAAAEPGWTVAQADAAAAKRVRAAKEEAAPTWAELTPGQQRALAPLAATWPALARSHKRKWLALSENYPRMTRTEQALLHSRMTEWAALSPRQRTLARLNFAETKKLPSDSKKALWEAYQALPPEEKRRLAAGGAAAEPAPPPAAAALAPVPARKQAKVPARKATAGGAGIAVAPERVDHNTLLPQPGAEPESSP